MEQSREVFEAWSQGTKGAGGYGNSPGTSAWLANDRCLWYRYKDNGAICRDENGYPEHAYQSPLCVCYREEDEQGPVMPPGWTVQQ